MFSTNGNYYDPKAENHTGLGVAPLIKPSSEELPIDVDVSLPSEYAMPMGTHSLPPGSASDGETADNNRTAVKPPVTRSASVSNIQTITLPTDPVPRLSVPTRPAPTHSSSSRLMSMRSDPRRLQPIPEYHTVVSFTPTQSRPSPSALTQPAPTHSGQAKSTPMYPTSAQSGRINSVPEGSGSTQSLSADSVQRQLTPSDLNHTVSVPEHSMHGSSASGGWSAPATGQYPKGDFRNSSQEALRDIQSTIMVNWLRQTQMERLWSGTLPGEGAVLKKGRGSFTCCPETLKNDSSEFYSQIVAMNVRCAITVSTPVINLFLTRHSADYVPLTDDLRIQVLPSVALLSSGQKHHFGAFIKDQRRLIVWDDDPKRVLERAEYILDSLVQMIWNQTEPAFDTNKQDANARIPDTERRTVTAEELEQGMIADKRPTLLINPIMVGITIALLISALGFGWRDLAQQVSVDHNYIRLAILAVTPSQVFVSLFFMQTIIVNLGQILGPINQLKINSKFYSGKPPPRLDRNLKTLPHMTIQMPVYKEGLRTVIQPTIRSLKAALSTYELQGGTGNIFVNDDGMQLLPDEEAQARKDFYDEHNIGWVARPDHNPKPNDGEKLFIRGGKFKKASNMNFALMISIKVEEALLNIQRDINWNQNKEQAAYQQCLAMVLEEDQHAWAAGDIRVGDYILLIDSDTRVPVDCLLDAASEMELSPQVAIMQYASGVMTVTDSFFEKGVTFFTNLIYTAIRYTVANGDVAPFVGHNAILRWSALQQVAYKNKEGPDKIWSESHVSEDFDMSLRLQIAGYTVRLGSYKGDGFKEGVSLTVYDELSRWEKYAYGCNELLFHPLRFWITRGPFTPLFRKFIFSNIRLTSKITIMAYIGTYYAIAAAWLLTLANYFIIGWFNGYIDHYYIDSFKVYFSLVVVFSAMGNFGLAILRYRLSEKSLLSATSENFKWLILLTIFLGGASLHISQAILCHFLGINMTWGATAKEAEDVSFFEEIPRLMSRFKFTFLFCFVCTGIIVAGVLFVPWPWQITDFVAIFPLTILVVSHFFLPVALNPALMQFTW